MVREAGDRGTVAPPPSGAGGLILQWLRDYPGGAALSERFKSAFKVVLAMIITYGISMGMDWDRAFWAPLR